MAAAPKKPAPKKLAPVPTQDKTPKAPTEAKALRSLPNGGGNPKNSSKTRRPFKPAK
jgi:hypothetical protein